MVSLSCLKYDIMVILQPWRMVWYLEQLVSFKKCDSMTQIDFSVVINIVISVLFCFTLLPQGAVLGPGEFFEGLTLGSRQFFEGTVGKWSIEQLVNQSAERGGNL